jgi:outer membrane protein TolC
MPSTVQPPVNQDVNDLPKETPALKQRDFFGAGSELKMLTLGEAVQMALKNNLDAKIEEVGILMENARVRNAYGEYDPVFSFSATRSWTQQPDSRNNISSADAVAQLSALQAQIAAINNNTLANQQFTNAILQALGRPPQTFEPIPTTTDLTSEGTIVFDQDLDRSEIALQARSPIGTIIRLSARAQRLRSTFEGDTRTITPIYTGTTSIEAKQPLFKDAGFDANLADIRISRKNKQAQELTWRFKVESTLQNVVSTYYEMLEGIADLENKGDAITAGLQLVAESQRRVELGFFTPYQVQQAQVQLQFDRENLLLGKNFYLGRQYQLQQLVLPEYSNGRLRVFLPTKMPSLRVPKLDREELLATAYENRLDYKAALALAEAEDVRVKFAKNQRKPQVDVVGSYGWTGLDTGYRDAFNQMTNSQGPSWQLGIQGSFPLGGIQPRAQLDLAEARKQQALLKIQQIELNIGLNVEQAIELIRTNQDRLKTAQLTVKTAEEATRVGYRQMQEGMIDSFNFIDQQRRLYDARTRELNARAELNKSITQLWLATGTVMKNLGINYTEEPKGRGKAAPISNAPAPVPAIVQPAAGGRKKK